MLPPGKNSNCHLLPPIEHHRQSRKMFPAKNVLQVSTITKSGIGDNHQDNNQAQDSDLPPRFAYVRDFQNQVRNWSPIPVTKRSTQDFFFALIFFSFIGFLCYTIAIVALEGKATPAILINGYDNFGNICGQNNDPIYNVSNSGQNMTSKRFLMLTLLSNVTLRATCVSKCPRSDFLITAFNRCLPRDSQIKLPLIVFEAYNVSRTLIESIVTDSAICWKELVYSASISFIISLIVILLLRFMAWLVIWTCLTSLLIFSGLGTIYVWLKWKSIQTRVQNMSPANPMRLELESEMSTWLIVSIIVTIFWFLFVLVIIVMRKRIQLASTLFREAGRAIGSMPLLLLQPFWTFTILSLVSISWLVGLIYLQSVRNPVVDDQTGFVFYRLENFYKLIKWYHLFAIIWIFHFLMACQHFIVAGSVSKWYFTRIKSDLESPIATSYWILIRYHLGSLALGSLFVSSVKMVRLLLKKLEVFVSRHQNQCTGFMRCCKCCLWFLEKFVIYINNNAYIEIALTGRSFCSSARRAFVVLSQNALRVAAVNSVGDFLLFLGKILIVVITTCIASKLVEDREPLLNNSWSPLIVSSLTAYFVAHCFLSVYEISLDTLLICFCEDQAMINLHPLFASQNMQSHFIIPIGNDHNHDSSNKTRNKSIPK